MSPVEAADAGDRQYVGPTFEKRCRVCTVTTSGWGVGIPLLR
jgi:hypothetical protein